MVIFMKSKKRLKFTRILLTFLVLFTGSFLYLNRGPKVDIAYDSEFLLGKPVKITITTYENFKMKSPEKLTVSISNRYNKNEAMEKTIKSYSDGKYELLITPNFAGEYQMHITYEDNDVSKAFNDSFLIK